MPETQPTAETSVRVEPLARWVLRDREIYPDASRDADSAFAECRKPTSCDRLPVHRSEPPTGYSSAGCSPAEPASASPVTDIVVQSRSSAAIKMRCSTPLPRCSPSRSSSCPSGTRVSSLLCTPSDISILRRQPCVGKGPYPEGSPAVARMAASGRRNESRISTRLSRSNRSARRSLKGHQRSPNRIFRSPLSAAVPLAAARCATAAAPTRSNWEAWGSAGSACRRSMLPEACTISVGFRISRLRGIFRRRFVI